MTSKHQNDSGAAGLKLLHLQTPSINLFFVIFALHDQNSQKHRGAKCPKIFM